MPKHETADYMTLPQLAALAGKSTSAMRDIRNRDKRFPVPDAQGRFNVSKVGAFFELLRLEKMTDSDFQEERRAARAWLLTQTFATPARMRRLDKMPVLTRQQAINEETEFLQA